MPEVSEVSLRQFVEAPYFKLLGRGSAILAVPLLVALAGYFLSLGDRVTKIEGDRAIKIVQYDAKLATIDQKVTAMGVDIDSIKGDTAQTKIDTANIRGILSEINRRGGLADSSFRP